MSYTPPPTGSPLHDIADVMRLDEAGADGLFYGNPGQFMTQVIACATTIIFVFVVTFIMAKILDATMGLRVSQPEEEVGLDLSEHGERAYS